MTRKLKWKVAPAPTGRYRSFEKRSWPSAELPDGRAGVCIACEDEYRPDTVHTGNHAPLTILVAKHHAKDEGAVKGGFTWMRLTRTAATLDEAKDRAQAFVNANDAFYPEEK